MSDDASAGAHQLVGNTLIGFGLFTFVCGIVAGPMLGLDLGFLSARDMMIIATIMVALGGWTRQRVEEP